MTYTMDYIIEAVATAFEVTPQQIIGNNKKRKFTRPRHAAMQIIRTKTNRSLTQIGRKFGRNHTAACYAEEMVPSFYKYDAQFKEMYDKALREMAAPVFQPRFPTLPRRSRSLPMFISSRGDQTNTANGIEK